MSIEDMFKPLDYEKENKNNMLFWYPLLRQIGMRVPHTILIHNGDCDLTMLIDGRRPQGFRSFLKRLQIATSEIGLPCFIRTGMTSSKHDWKDSCYLEDNSDENLEKHICNLVEYSCMANIAGLPLDCSVIAVRELIPTQRIITAFNDMPITVERRVFIRDGKVICNHPYWPEEAFKNGISKEDLAKLHELSVEDAYEIELMAVYIAKYFTGFWSVDFLRDINGKWWVTDMAVGERSYHYPLCKENINA